MNPDSDNYYNGYAYQVFLNLPFGETMAEQITSSGYYQNHYKFNGKELDNETGMYYYGARYYEPRLSVWMSVDPLMDKYAGISPYAYCVNNPIILVDPKGRDWFETTNDDGSKSVKWNKSTGATFKDKSGTWKNIGNSYNQKLDDGSYINHYQNYISSVGDFEKEEDMIKSHFSFLISNKAEIPIEDKKTIFNSRVASRGVEQPDMIALTFGGNYYVGGGIGYDINLGYIKGEGFFSNLSLKPGPGADVSWGVGLTVGDYRGDGSPNAKSLNGFGTHLSGSLFGLEVSQGMDINYQAGKIGGVWRTTTTGGSFGSSSLMGGSGGVSYTIPLFSKIKLK